MSTVRARWRAEVYRSGLITDSVRVLLLLLAEEMHDDGFVSVPRATLAAQLGRSPRRITERFTLAIKAEFLEREKAGAPGRTAEYRASFPDDGGARAHRADCSPHKGAPVRTTNGAPVRTSKGAPGGPANHQASVSEPLTGKRGVSTEEDLDQITAAARDELAKLTRRSFDTEWCSKVVGQILDGRNPKNAAAYVRASIRADVSRFIPTPTPPVFRAPVRS